MATDVGATLAAARKTWGETGEILLDTGLTYGDGTAVEILIRKRGRRYDLGDRGVATRKAGPPRRWLETAERVVAEEGFNVNRAGVVFAPAVEGRDLAALALRLADTCLAVHSELLELADETVRL